MKRVDSAFAEKGKKERPNWEIVSLYNSRRLVVDKKITKYCIPFDSSGLPKSQYFNVNISCSNSEDILNHRISEPATLFGRESFCHVKLTQKFVSRQHFVIQFRKVILKNDPKPQIIHYLFDMGSNNGTFLNGTKVLPNRYIQLFSKDVITFEKSNNPDVFIMFFIGQTGEKNESESEN